jgi:hypothetical protein
MGMAGTLRTPLILSGVLTGITASSSRFRSHASQLAKAGSGIDRKETRRRLAGRLWYILFGDDSLW